MSNELVKVALPEHLLAIFGQNSAVSSIGEGLTGAHPVITVTLAKRFRLKEGDVETDLGPTIDVLVVGINPNKSTVVYDKKFDNKTDPTAPLFSSDNGEPVPTDLLEKVISDSRKWAVILADNPDGAVHELRVPAASIFRGDTYVDKLNKRGAPVAALVTTLSFDPNEDYARLIFTPKAYVDAAQAQAITAVAGSLEVDAVLGRNRKAQRNEGPKAETQVFSPAPAPVAEAPKPRARKASAPVAQALEFAMPVATPSAGLGAVPLPTTQAAPVLSASQATVTQPQVASLDLEATIANVLKM